MLTHVCRETGWTVEYVLSMPARRFYAMRLELLRIEHKTKTNFLYDLCDVAAIPLCNGDYYEQVKAMFKEAAMEPDERERLHRRRRHVFDASDPEDSRQAAFALKRLMGDKMVIRNG